MVDDKCTACGACVDACPSHAISLVPDEYPAPQEKTDAVVDTLLGMLKSKSGQEMLAAAIRDNTDDPVLRQLAEAFGMSNRLMAEDLIREAGFLLPQGGEVKKLLDEILEMENSDDFPAEAVRRLKELL